MKKFVAVALAVLMACCLFANGTQEAAAAGSSTSAVFPVGDTLTIIVPVSAGAGMDTQARLIGQYLAKELGKNVVIENIAGGATTIGCQTYLSEDPDADTIIMLSTDHLVLTPVLQKASYSHEDFQLLSANQYSEEFFWVPVESPWKTWDDVVAASKSSPVIFGTGAKSGPVYIATKCACELTGVNMQNVVSNSIPESIANMLGGNVQITWSSYSTARDYYLSGKIRPILGTGVEKFTGENGEIADGVPTLQGMGYDFKFSSCNTFCIRKGVDQAKVDYIRQALLNTYRNPEFKEAWIAAGLNYVEDSSYTFAEKAAQAKIDLLPQIKQIWGL